MNLRRIKHTLLRMSAQEKVIGIASIVMVVGTFLPWYNVVMSVDQKTLTENGLTGDLGVMGFVVLIMSILSFLFLVGENLHLPLPRFGYKREGILFFLLGQCTFLTLLIMGVYTKRALDFTDADLRFGIYMVLIGGFFATFSAFSLVQKNRQRHREEFFGEEEVDQEEGLPQRMRDEGLEEEYSEMDAVDEELLENSESHDLDDEIEAAFENTYQPRRDTPTPTVDPKQSNYFIREAGVSGEANEEEKDTPKKNNANHFYEDN